MAETANKNIVKSLFWTYGEKLSTQFVSILVSIILARLLSPDDYGVISIVMVFILFCDIFVTGGFGQALVQKKDADDLDFNSMFICSCVSSVLLYGVIFGGAPFVADFYERPIIIPVLRILGLRLIVSSFNTIQQAKIQKSMTFKKSFFATVAGTLLSAVVGVILAYCGFGVWALVGQYLVSIFVVTIALARICDWSPRLQFSWARSKLLINFGWKVLLTTICFTLVNDFRSLVVGKKFGPGDLAFYDQGQKFPNLIVTNINASIGRVLFPAFSNRQDDLKYVKQLCRKGINLSTFLLAPLLIGLIAVADTFVEVVLTEKWAPCVFYMRMLTLMFLVRPFTTTCHQAIMALGRSDITLKIMFVINVIAMLLLCIALFVLNSVPMVAVGSVLSEFVSVILFMYYIKRFIGYTYMDQICDVFPSLALSAIMGGAIFSLSFVLSNKMMLFIAQIGAGILIYTIGSTIFKMKGVIFILSRLSRKIPRVWFVDKLLAYLNIAK
ncbi:lipopolysaccharide biosynthesis protein [Candidatus Saccharibacteria bacterium]|nr:lipopolysaccharide biosynthesis protein [Candidatus Saccharibacteria bacterium]